MSTLSIGDVVRRVRRELEDEPQEDHLIAAASAGATEISVNQASIWLKDDVAEFGDDSGEQVKVRMAGTNTLTVKRAHNDSDAVAHANGATVLRNPRYAYGLIVNALTETVAELWPYAWAIREFSITPSSTENLYALPPDFIDLATLTQEQTGGTATAYAIYGTRGSGLTVSVRQGLGTGDFGTGKALYLPVLDNTTSTLNLRYRAELTSSDIEDGLMASAVIYGTCSKLVSGKDAARVATLEPNTPYGAGLKSGMWYRAEFERVRYQLRNQLYRTVPPARQFIG